MPARSRSLHAARHSPSRLLALSAVLNTHRLSQNGYANIFYSAGVYSMLRSLHNFVFVSFDPGGLITVDKPPLALWLQAASAKLFGFSPLSLLLPEALAGVLAVALLYLMLARRLGAAAAFAGALALAVFPSFVAVSRDNGVDPAADPAAGARLQRRAARMRNGALAHADRSAARSWDSRSTPRRSPPFSSSLRSRSRSSCARPGRRARRIVQLLVAGLVMVAVSFAWIAFVELTPASKRPYVGSSTNNTELGLTFEYNGLGRVEGQDGGPNSTAVRPGAYVPAARQLAVDAAARSHPAPARAGRRRISARAALSRGNAGARAQSTDREKDPIPFGESPEAAAPVRQGPRRPGRLAAAVRAVRAARPGGARARGAQARRARGRSPGAASTGAIRDWRPC